MSDYFEFSRSGGKGGIHSSKLDYVDYFEGLRHDRYNDSEPSSEQGKGKGKNKQNKKW
jgi:hypothetical protein